MRWRCLPGEWDAIVTLLAEAMRYYCLWIYACNAVLLVSVIVFLAYAVSVTSDYRLAFVPHVKFYHPTFLYAYVAVVFQGGVIQTLGCYAARRLNERLLNIYWTLLLVLIVGDAVVGVVWILRYDRICQDLIPLLHIELANSYGVDAEFTRRWDRLQVDSKCCGIAGPLDYNSTVSFTYNAASRYSENGEFTNGNGAAAIAAAASMMGAAAALIADVSDGGSDTLTFFVPATCCHPSQALPMQLMTFNSATGPTEASTTPSALESTLMSFLVATTPSAEDADDTDRSDALDSLTNPDARFDSYRKTFEDNWAPEQRLDAWLSWMEKHEKGELEKEKDEDGTPADQTEELSRKRRERRHHRRRRSTHRHRHWQKSPSRQHGVLPQHLPFPAEAAWAPHRLVRDGHFHSTPSPHQSHNFTCRDGHLAPNMEPRLVGCGPELVAWMSRSADTLFVLGFCVIAFIKICFLGLLRYEIKEMIQKIKVLRCEGEARQNEFVEIAAAFGAAAQTQAQTSAATANHVPIVPTPQTPYPPTQPNAQIPPCSANSTDVKHEAQLNSRSLDDCRKLGMNDEDDGVICCNEKIALTGINSSRSCNYSRQRVDWDEKQKSSFLGICSPGMSQNPHSAESSFAVTPTNGLERVTGDGNSSSDSSRSPLLGHDNNSRCFSDCETEDFHGNSAMQKKKEVDNNIHRPLFLVMPPSVAATRGQSDGPSGSSGATTSAAILNHFRADDSAENKNRRLREELHEMSELLRLTGRQTEI